MTERKRFMLFGWDKNDDVRYAGGGLGVIARFDSIDSTLKHIKDPTQQTFDYYDLLDLDTGKWLDVFLAAGAEPEPDVEPLRVGDVIYSVGEVADAVNSETLSSTHNGSPSILWRRSDYPDGLYVIRDGKKVRAPWPEEGQ